MYKKIAVILIIVPFLVFDFGCGKKDENKQTSTDTSGVSKLITTDPGTGKQKVSLKYMVRKGEKFSYKMTAKTSTTEKSPATDDKEVKQDNEINYFYTKEVTDLDASGIMTFRVTFDSIKITSVQGEQSINYNSNVNDTVHSNPAFIQYNSVIKEPLFIRVSPEGEITDVYGLEKIYDNIFKALGDTLKEADKESIKASFGKESISEILQQEYQMVPKQDVLVDSSWVKSYDTQILFFDVKNSAKYTLKGIEDKNGDKIANIEAGLNVEFLKKEVEERGVKLHIENSETSGSGKIAFDLNRGCIMNKETTTSLKLEMKMSAQGQSAKSEQTVVTNLYVSLLN